MRCIPAVLSLALTAATLGPAPLRAQAAPVKATIAEMLEPLMLLWRDGYQTVDPSTRFEFQTALGAQVAQAFVEGKSPIAPMSRELNPEELAAFKAKWGYAPTRVSVALDALVMLVHESNPIKEARLEQLDAVWSQTRLMGWPKDIRTWGELGVSGANWANRPIVLIGHPDGSGTRAFFREAVEAGGKGKDNVRRSVDILSSIEEVIANQAAMTYGSISQVFKGLKAIPIVPVGGKSAVAAKTETIQEGTYPMRRFLAIYVNKAPGKPLDPAIGGFLRYTLSPEGQKQVETSGFVALSKDQLARQMRLLER